MRVRFENEIYNLEYSSDRRILHEVIEEYVGELEDEVLEELELAHELISNKDVKGLIDGFFVYSELVFLEVEENEMLKDALESAGYKVESSNVSRSLYAINDNGEEVRISNHKRPAVEQNGIYEKVEYEKEIITKNNIVYLRQLKEGGFSKLDKSEYLLSHF